jgi:hypothetical protein
VIGFLHPASADVWPRAALRGLGPGRAGCESLQYPLTGLYLFDICIGLAIAPTHAMSILSGL